MAENELDIELILALAAGALPDAEAAAAEAALDDVARDELAIQRMALEAMQEMPQPALSAAERSELRTSVGEAINLVPATPASTRRAAGAPWYARLLPAMAGLAALVVVVGVGLNLGGGDSDSAGSDGASAVDNTAAAEAAQPTGGEFRADEEAVTEAAEASPMAQSAAPAEAAEAADAAGTDVGAEASATTAASAADAELPSEFRYAYVGDLTSASGDLLDAMSDYAEVYSGDIPLPIEDAAGFFAEVVTATCWEDALEAVTSSAPVQAVLSAGFGTWDGQAAEFYEFLRDDDQVVAVMLVDSCTVVATQVR